MFSTSRTILYNFSKSPILNKSLIIVHQTGSGLGPWCLVRHGSTAKFTRNMQFYSADDAPLPVSRDFKLPSSPRPLTILMAWLLSKDAHTNKFVKLYTDLGFDVLRVRVSPLDLLRPATGSQRVAADLLSFLRANPSPQPVLVHGFSVGAYVFCEAMVQAGKEPSSNAGLGRVRGQVWDSAVDLHGIPEGVSNAVTSNPALKGGLKRGLQWYLRALPANTAHYAAASAAMHSAALRSPALFLMSDADPVSTPAMNEAVYGKWRDSGLPVFTKQFSGSPHVSHYHRHRAEYTTQLLSFLRYVDLLNGSQEESATTKDRPLSEESKPAAPKDDSHSTESSESPLRRASSCAASSRS